MAVYGISYSNNRGHIYSRTPVTRTVKLAGSSYRAGRLCIIIPMIRYDSSDPNMLQKP